MNTEMKKIGQKRGVGQAGDLSFVKCEITGY